MSNKFKISTGTGIQDTGSSDKGIVEISGPAVNSINSTYDGQDIPQLRIGNTNDNGSLMIGLHNFTSSSTPNSSATYGDFVKGGSFIQSDYNNSNAELHIQPNGGNIEVGVNKPFNIDQTFRINGVLDIQGLRQNGQIVDLQPAQNGQTPVSFFRVGNTNNIVYYINGPTTGFVGIGTPNPQAKLEVIGDISGSHKLTIQGNVGFGLGDSNPIYNLEIKSLVNSGRYYFNVKDNEGIGFDGNTIQGLTSSSNGALFLNKSDGNVGIGNTSAASGKLQVYQPDNTNWAQSWSNQNGSFAHILKNTVGLWIRPVDTVSTAFQCTNITNGDSPIFIVKTAGNVGIGTSSPKSHLDIKENFGISSYVANSKTDFMHNMYYSGGWKNINQGPASLMRLYGGSSETSSIRFYTTTAGLNHTSNSSLGNEGSGVNERMRITADGNVGIGEDNPIFKLDIAAPSIPAGAGTTSPGIRVEGEPNDNGDLAWFINQQDAGSYSNKPFIFQNKGGVDEWNASRASNGTALFIIDQVGPSNDIGNTSKSFFNDGVSFLVGNNLFDSTHKQVNFIVKQNGNVAIGNYDTTHKLYVKADSGDSTVYIHGTSGYAQLYLDGPSVNYLSYTNALHFFSASTQLNPIKLHTSGDIDIAGKIVKFPTTNTSAGTLTAHSLYGLTIGGLAPSKVIYSIIGFNMQPATNDSASDDAYYYKGSFTHTASSQAPAGIIFGHFRETGSNEDGNIGFITGYRSPEDYNSNQKIEDDLAMLINEARNVGIGTNEPVVRLDISGHSRLFNQGWNGTNKPAGGRLYFAGANQFPYACITGIDNRVSAANTYQGGMAFYTFTHDTPGNADTGSDNINLPGYNSTRPCLKRRMTIDNTGNVGIGTDSPSNALEINGWIGRTEHNNGALCGSYNNIGNNQNNSNPIYVMGSGYKPLESSLDDMYGIGYCRASASFIGATDSGYGLYIAAGGDANIWLSGSPGKVSYFNSGNVGIGTTDPQAKLDVKKSSSDYEPTIKIESETGPNYIQFSKNNNALGYIGKLSSSTDNMYFHSNNGIMVDSLKDMCFNSLEDMRFDSSVNNIVLQGNGGSGNVNIGTNTSGAKLTIGSGKMLFFNPNNDLASPSSGANGSIGTRIVLRQALFSEEPYSLGVENNAMWYGVPGNASHKFYVGNSLRMMIDSEGNCGIGTNDPDEKLDVNGNININGYLKRNSLNKGVLLADLSSGIINKHCPIFMLDGNTKPTDTDIKDMTGIGFAHTSDIYRTGLTGLPMHTQSSDSGFGIYFASDGTINSFISCGKYNVVNEPGSSFLMGKLGIGNTSPTEKLDVNGNISFNGTIHTDSSAASGTNSVSIGWSNAASGNYSVAIGYDNEATGNGSFAMGYYNLTSNDYSVAMGYDNHALQDSSVAVGKGNKINSNGHTGGFVCGRYSKIDSSHLFAVGCGSGTSSRDTVIYATQTEFHCTGDIVAYSTSDSRLKTNLKNIENPLDKIQKINGYTFDWIENSELHSNKGSDVGVIAQEVEEILPEVVTTRDNGYKAVKYEKVVPLLIECIKSQDKQIDNLKEENTELKQRLANIEQRLANAGF